ncbi:non-homologous end joining protein Ku [Marinicrinis sediminis]|uniref:Non-homologous end joining protein Ku n=1 Tax=Marinicrinis sediminis TaxID=1652465 RepID=A0ABW5R6W3_9BACL
MHTLWKGAISFGLVHVPIRMFAATEHKDIAMRYIHTKCGSPISYVRTCKHCDEQAEWGEIAKGYEYEPEHFVLFEKEELEQLGGEKNKEIKILDFVNLEDIDPIYFQKTYYLGPGDTGSNAYQLLMQAMQSTGKIGIAKVTIRSKSSLAAIRVYNQCLCLETIFFPDEIRTVQQVPNLPEQLNVNDQELNMAQMLIEQLSAAFEPEKYHDEYRQELQQLIDRKIAGEEVQVTPEQPKTNVIDLMAALQASLKATEPDQKARKSTKKNSPKKAAAKNKSESATVDQPASKKRTPVKKKEKEPASL